MLTSKDREEAFSEALEKLLKEHEAEMSVTDDGRPYGMQSGICIVSLKQICDASGSIIADYAEFNL